MSWVNGIKSAAETTAEAERDRKASRVVNFLLASATSEALEALAGATARQGEQQRQAIDGANMGDKTNADAYTRARVVAIVQHLPHQFLNAQRSATSTDVITRLVKGMPGDVLADWLDVAPGPTAGAVPESGAGALVGKSFYKQVDELRQALGELRRAVDARGRALAGLTVQIKALHASEREQRAGGQRVKVRADSVPGARARG